MNGRVRRAAIALMFLAVLLAIAPGAGAAGRRLAVGWMYEGETVTLGPKLKGVPVEQLEWRSSDEWKVSVEGGRVEGRMAGKAVIAASKGGATAYCGVVVLPHAVRLQVGEIVSLPSAGREKYRVEDESIAAVNRKGQILGRSAGATRVGIDCGKRRMIVQVSVVDGGEAQQSAAAELDCAGEAQQIVLVEHRGGSTAKISVHEKASGVWTQLWSGDAYVGRNGIGKTREGDGKTPTGTYNLIQPFGIKADPGANMSYTKVSKYHYWCGTSGSEYYNQLVDERTSERKHSSSDEYLINYKGVYNYCMFIDYNAAGAAGKGSCIFLHCKGSKDSTAGCIAVDEAVMKRIIQWARPGCKIVIK